MPIKKSRRPFRDFFAFSITNQKLLFNLTDYHQFSSGLYGTNIEREIILL